jgi:hypothetical protein
MLDRPPSAAALRARKSRARRRERDPPARRVPLPRIQNDSGLPQGPPGRFRGILSLR